MIRMKQVMAFARAERIITRRLVRYWFFLSLAYFIAFICCALLYYIHGIYSSYSGTVSAASPRFLLGIIGRFYSAIFLIGTIFLAFDIRARDNRERMSEVLDSRPYSNLELVTGRFIGIFLCSWIPLVVLAILLDLIGIILAGLDAPVGEPIEIFSLFSFVFVMAIPALSFAIALVFFITLLVRNRFAAAAILIVLIGLYYCAIIFSDSVSFRRLFDIIGFSGVFFSTEIVRKIATPEVWMQRFSLLFAAFSLIGFSAVIHPRLDGVSRLKLTAGSIIAVIMAFSFLGVAYYNNMRDIKIMEIWREAHKAFIDEPEPDLKKITGAVKISPGKDLVIDLDITFGAPEKRPIKKAFFTLNPGQRVKNVSDSTGKTVTFTHENGLLELTLPQILDPNEETTIHISLEGLPDNHFAFLQSAYNPLDPEGSEPGDIVLLGKSPGIFSKAFVALMPGLRWLPASGSEKDRDDPRIRAIDYFKVDLKIELPMDWLAAGPGRRYKVKEDSGGVIFRFSPPAPVSEVALIASRFESRTMEVEGVTFEVLLHKKHMKNLEVMAEAGGKIREWLEYRLRETKEYGLSYPYDALTLVEVPNILRSYGGGWRLDTVMAPPGMLLMKETSFPMARFDTAFRKPERFKDMEGGIQQAKWERLKTFFINDFLGGNILSGGTRDFFLYQTSAIGPEGLALNYVTENLSNLLITENMSYFSTHEFLHGDGFNRNVRRTMRSYARDPLMRTSMVDTAIGSVVSRPEVWDRTLGVSLKDMDPWEDPALTDYVLTLKTKAIAQIILDTLGYEKTWQLLASIRQSCKGRSFSFNRMVETGKELGFDLTEILGDWINSTNLPGFVCSNAKIYRIADSENGSPCYQMLFTIRNDEPVPGFFRFVYYNTGERKSLHVVESQPIRVAGKSTVQFGTIVSKPPVTVQLKPYLSLNRRSIYIPLNKLDEGKIEKTEAIEGLETLPYSLPQEVSIVVDDLDPGFMVIEEKKHKGLRIMTRGAKKRFIDQRLPLTINYYQPPSNWSRLEYASSFGKYRQTLAVVGAGDGEKKAIFTTEISQAGQWDLELHFPLKQNLMPYRKWGTYNLIVTNSNGDQYEIQFDSKAASIGWNLVESINLPKGETSVTILDKTDGQFVVADAIRWSPSPGN